MESYDYKIEESPSPSNWTRLLRFVTPTVVFAVLALSFIQSHQISELKGRVDELSHGNEMGSSQMAKQLSDTQSKLTALEAELGVLESEVNQLKQQSSAQAESFKTTTSDLQQRIKKPENRR